MGIQKDACAVACFCSWQAICAGVKLLLLAIQAVIQLSAQYRMAAPIMALANSLFYGGTLRCGDASVAQSQIHIPNAECLCSFPSWVQQVMPHFCLTEGMKRTVRFKLGVLSSFLVRLSESPSFIPCSFQNR